MTLGEKCKNLVSVLIEISEGGYVKEGAQISVIVKGVNEGLVAMF